MDKLVLDYNALECRVVFRAGVESAPSSWYQQLRRSLQDQTQDVSEPETGVLTAPWWSFVSISGELGAILKAANVSYTATTTADELLRSASKRKAILRTPSLVTQPSEVEVISRLIAAGWNWEERKLTNEQMRNVRKMDSLPSAATFSVPGAGKTSEALAFFLLKARPSDHLLVVAPKNAFGSWDEQLGFCVGGSAGAFSRLRGGRENIEVILTAAPRLMLMTYQQLARLPDIVAKFVGERRTFVFLDESHKIKSGRGKITAQAVLRLSHLPVGKLILSGTPMPQSVEDLIPQFEFLYPEVRATPQDIVAKMQPIFVRTTKDELKLPPVDRKTIPVPFNPAQKKLYDLMCSEVARQAEQTLTHGSRLALRRLGKSIMRLLEVVSNPALLARDIVFLHQDLLGEVLAEGAAPKVRFACERARRLARAGEKSIIWTTFRQNVESIADQLKDLRAVYIHGGIDAGTEDDGDTREGRIRQFRSDPNCFVMVANPAAASEGISLHKVCHHAIYVDRTYNAAHYLQSEDRIHRLGLLAHESPTVEILQCPGSIDESVQVRLETKVAAMAAALNDRSLSIATGQYIPFDTDDDPESESETIDMDDVKSILDWLKRSE